MEALKFCDYFGEWMAVYKNGAVRPITYQKYVMTLKRIKEIAPLLTMAEMNKRTYQSIINEYAKTHEKLTVLDFHNHLKAAILDAIDEGVITVNPCRNTVIKCVESRKNKKIKALSVDEFEKLIKTLDLSGAVNWDWMIYLIAKTGVRFAEALALTPNDFDFARKTVSVSKSLNYKSGNNEFIPTKTKSSIRKIAIDDKTGALFAKLLERAPANKPIFSDADKRIFNSTVNNRLFRICKTARIPVISIHGLRHTHASVLFCLGVSVFSVSKRLGHANVTITQNTYIHIINELEDKDAKKITGYLSGI